MHRRRGIAAYALVTAGLLCGALAPSAAAGPASTAAENQYLSDIHSARVSQEHDPQLFEDDRRLLSNGYYACHLANLGTNPETQGISPLISDRANRYLCAAYNANPR